MALFVAHGAGVVTRRVLLTLGPNGDWRSANVQFHLPWRYHGVWSADDAIDFVTDGIMVALCSVAPRLYPRHRWVGADLALDDLGVFEGCHRLLSSTYVRLCATYLKGLRRDQALACLPRVREYNAADLPMALGDDFLDQGDDDEGVQGGDAGAEPVPERGVEGQNPPEGGHGQDADVAETFAERNRKPRGIGLRWVMSDPFIDARRCAERVGALARLHGEAV